MSTRGTRNEDVGREHCRELADQLVQISRPDEEGDCVALEVAEMLREIADGADPAEVLFGGNPQRNDGYARRIVDLVESLRGFDGFSQQSAFRVVAAREGIRADRVQRLYFRARSRLRQASPLPETP